MSSAENQSNDFHLLIKGSVQVQNSTDNKTVPQKKIC